jgi:uncharacterized protein YndB with AHSA1/START domain
MTDATQHACRVVIRAPIQKVWDVLTTQNEILPHFFGSVMHTSDGLRAGSVIHMRTPDGKYTGVIGEILECDPPHRFSHTFRFTQYNDPECKVTFELKEIEGGVELTLLSEQLPVGSKTAKSMIQGSAFITDVLKSVCETGRPSFGKRLLLRVIRMTAFLSPKACRSERWPMAS